MSMKWYIDSEVLFSHNKEQITDASYNMGETRTHAMWKKPDAKEVVWFRSDAQKRQIYRDSILVVTWGWG